MVGAVSAGLYLGNRFAAKVLIRNNPPNVRLADFPYLVFFNSLHDTTKNLPLGILTLRMKSKSENYQVVVWNVMTEVGKEYILKKSRLVSFSIVLCT